MNGEPYTGTGTQIGNQVIGHISGFDFRTHGTIYGQQIGNQVFYHGTVYQDYPSSRARGMVQYGRPSGRCTEQRSIRKPEWTRTEQRSIR